MPVKIGRASAAKSVHVQRMGFLRDAFGSDKAKGLQAIADALPSEIERDLFYERLARDYARAAGHPIDITQHYKTRPVEVETFCRDEFYLGMGKELRDPLARELIEANNGNYVEAVWTGGIGSGKTTGAVLTCAYQLYLLSLLDHPHDVLGQDRASEIEMIFQSITATLAELVDYARFKALIERSPYFKDNFPFDKNIKSRLEFPHRIIVKPVSGSNLATIGQNVIGGLIDELNYMAVIDQSKRTVDKGVYDQAVALYNSIARRRMTRFMKQGKMPGILCLVSSKKYPGQFTDVKIEEAQTNKAIFIYDKRVWDLKPEDYSKDRFRVFIGDEFRQPRKLKPGEVLDAEDEAKHITEVPTDFEEAFDRDVVDALREIAGISHQTKTPFFRNKVPLVKVFSDKTLRSVFSRDEADFVHAKLAILKKSIRDPQWPRFAHVDLGLTGDAAGVALGYCPGFAKIVRDGHVEIMPNIVMDGVVRVVPPRGGEIMFEKIRRLFYVLRDVGINVKWVSYDSFQSVDSMQMLRTRGFVVGQVSLDKTMIPYDFFKTAVLDGRVLCPNHPWLYGELRDLQIDYKHTKVDHLPNKTKDCADAMAGVVYGLTVLRDTWFSHEVPINDAVMAAVAKASAALERAQARHARSATETEEG